MFTIKVLGLILTPKQMSKRLQNLSELESHLTFRISRLSKLLEIHAVRELVDTGLNLTWYRILLVLQIFEETTAADLSRLMVMDRAQISRATADLLKAGLLTTRPDPTSKRKKLLKLTAEGQSEIEAVRGRFKARQVNIEHQLSADDLRGLTDSIDKLSAYLAEELQAPEAAPARFAVERPTD